MYALRYLESHVTVGGLVFPSINCREQNNKMYYHSPRNSNHCYNNDGLRRPRVELLSP